MGQGYFPLNRVSVTCATAVGNFTVQYSGEATAPAPQIGAMISSQADKTLAAGVPANAGFTAQTIRAPFGNSGGSIYFLYSAAGPAGSTISVACSTLAIATVTPVASFPLTTASTPQFFTIPLLPCDFVTFSYTSGGASAVTFTASYVFNAITVTGGDPCQGSTAVKKSVAINIGTATTTQLVALLTGHAIFVCGYNFTLAGAGSTALLEYGTGAACGTGTTALTGAMEGGAAGAPDAIDSGGGGYSVASTPASNALCMLTAGTVSARGILTFVQQ